MVNKVTIIKRFYPVSILDKNDYYHDDCHLTVYPMSILCKNDHDRSDYH